MNNQQYVRTLEIGKDAQAKCLQIMEKYGNNHWWESSDPATIAYYQINESTFLLKDFGDFHGAVETLLGHGVPNIILGSERVKQEVRDAWMKSHQ